MILNKIQCIHSTIFFNLKHTKPAVTFLSWLALHPVLCKINTSEDNKQMLCF